MTMNPTEEQLAKLADSLKTSRAPSERVLADTIRWHLDHDNQAQKVQLWERLWERFGFAPGFRLC